MGLFFGRSRRSSRPKSLLGSIPGVRWIGPLVTTAGMLVAGYMTLSGKIDLSSLDMFRGSDPVFEAKAVELRDLGGKSQKTIRIATFNINEFSDRKSSDQEAMESIAQIVASFDVVAIQEVVSDKIPIERLVDLINRSNGRYEMAISEPIGRTPQKESYAYVWDATRIMMIPDSDYVVGDGQGDSDRMQREPYVASFRTLAPTREGHVPFTFTLINVHTDPAVVSNKLGSNNELNVLDDVFVSVGQYENNLRQEEDFILLGNLNVDQSNLAELGRIQNVKSITGDLETNTARTKTYDHVILDARYTREWTGHYGVYDIEKELGVVAEKAAKISDHLPVWAEFSFYEIQSETVSLATKPTGTPQR